MKGQNIMAEFGEILKELRKQRKLSQESLATALGVSKSIIGLYENGKRTPSRQTLEAIADYFNVDIDYLLGREKGSVYYMDPEVANIANELKDRPDLRVLLDASRDLDKTDMFELIDIINKIKGGKWKE